MKTAQRLRDARVRAGFASASDAARALGVGVSTYLGHENGHRGFTIEDATLYARRFGISLDWLLLGKGQVDHPQTALVGTPVIGTIDHKAWEAREPVSLDRSDEELELVMLSGRRSEEWFAVRIPYEYPPDHLREGDFLLCRRSAEIDHDRLGLVERAVDGGELGVLRQITLVACRKDANGDRQLVIRPLKEADIGKPITGEYRILGQVANALRGL